MTSVALCTYNGEKYIEEIRNYLEALGGLEEEVEEQLKKIG